MKIWDKVAYGLTFLTTLSAFGQNNQARKDTTIQFSDKSRFVVKADAQPAGYKMVSAHKNKTAVFRYKKGDNTIDAFVDKLPSTKTISFETINGMTWFSPVMAGHPIKKTTQVGLKNGVISDITRSQPQSSNKLLEHENAVQEFLTEFNGTAPAPKAGKTIELGDVSVTVGGSQAHFDKDLIAPGFFTPSVSSVQGKEDTYRLNYKDMTEDNRNIEMELYHPADPLRPGHIDFKASDIRKAKINYTENQTRKGVEVRYNDKGELTEAISSENGLVKDKITEWRMNHSSVDKYQAQKLQKKLNELFNQKPE